MQGPAAPSADPDGKKDPKKDGKDPGPDPTKIANADPTAPSKPPEEAAKGGKGEEASATAPPPVQEAALASSSPIVVAAAPAKPPAAEEPPPRPDAVATNKESVPAPPSLTGQTGASLLDGSPTVQAPVPAPPALPPAESPSKPTVPAAAASDPEIGASESPGPGDPIAGDRLDALGDPNGQAGDGIGSSLAWRRREGWRRQCRECDPTFHAIAGFHGWVHRIVSAVDSS